MGPRISARRSRRFEPMTGIMVRDTRWTNDVRYACSCAVVLFGLLLAIDALAGTLGAVRTALWSGLGLLLFLVLLPPRVAVGPGRLEVRGIVRTRRVRTDRLVSATWSDGVGQRLILVDADGGRVQFDPRVLIADPRLWHVLDADVRAAQANDILRQGAPSLRRLGRQVDRENARAVFTISGLET